ncbi:Serine/threonine-protein kinase [Dirofilaria immitis]
MAYKSNFNNSYRLYSFLILYAITVLVNHHHTVISIEDVPNQEASHTLKVDEQEIANLRLSNQMDSMLAVF